MRSWLPSLMVLLISMNIFDMVRVGSRRKYKAIQRRKDYAANDSAR